jgi:hypothetical protein
MFEGYDPIVSGSALRIGDTERMTRLSNFSAV